MEPNDTFEDDLKTIQYNKAIDALIPIVKEDYCFFEGFLMDEYPDAFNQWDDLKLWHSIFQSAPVPNYSGPMISKWLEAVHEESERRVIG